ncbi:hypothetical protein BD779DRAFT_1568848 [Infundibulicybe gibba]|nr:hypothetical protein BD779DRAFT_1568848 [Infundibulicybe gibba]
MANGPGQPRVAHDQEQGLGSPTMNSPIMNLNVDVLRKIFVLCLPSGPVRIPLMGSEPRLVLSHVCSSWRALALHTPELWSYLTVGRLERPRHYMCLKTWLRRSAQSLLSIHERMLYNSKGIGEFDRIVWALTMHVTPVMLRALSCLPPGSLQALVGVDFHFSGDEFIKDLLRRFIDTPITALQMVPQLRCFTRIPIQRPAILELHGMKFTAESCIAILHACAALESCIMSVASIDELAINEVHAHAAPAVVLPMLHTLYLGLSGDVFYAPFLNAFHLPGLRFLKLHGDYMAQCTIASLTSILAPMAHTLQVLRDPPDRDMHAILELLPHLRECDIAAPGPWRCSARTLYKLFMGTLCAEELLDIAEGRLRAAQESTGTVSVITELHGMCESPYGDDAAMARLEALSSAGVRIHFDLDSLSDFEFSESGDGSEGGSEDVS